MTPIYTLPTTEKQKATGERFTRFFFKSVGVCFLIGFGIFCGLVVLGGLIANVMMR